MNSSKKRTNEFVFTGFYMFLFVFWKKLRTPQRHFEIIWPLGLFCFGSGSPRFSDLPAALHSVSKRICLVNNYWKCTECWTRCWLFQPMNCRILDVLVCTFYNVSWVMKFPQAWLEISSNSLLNKIRLIVDLQNS